jgi:hypothetical protein
VGLDPAGHDRLRDRAGGRHLTAPRERRYAMRDAAGQCMAVHVRRDLPGATRPLWRWESPDGTRSLGGLSPTELSLLTSTGPCVPGSDPAGRLS